MAFSVEVFNKMLNSKLFTYCGLDEIERFTQIASTARFTAGEKILTEGQEGNEFYMILKGRIGVHINSLDQNKLVELKTLREGDLLGEMVLLGKNRRTASAIAQNDCELVSWNCLECLSYFEKDSHFGYRIMSNFAQILSDRIHDMNLQLRNNTESVSPNFLGLLRSV